MKITLKHLHTIPGTGKKPGWCNTKARDFFKRHNLDWYAFRHGGVDEQDFLATGDGLALALVEWAHESERIEQERQA